MHMGLSVDTTNAYTNFQVVEFTTDLVGNKIIEFGDGNFEYFQGLTVNYTYSRVGNFKACVRLCQDVGFLDINCVDMVIEHFVKDIIIFDQYPVSSYSGIENDPQFILSLSSNCPPPIYVDLSVRGTLSREGDKLNNCDPVHYFFGDAVSSNTIILNDPKPIYVNDIVAGYHDSVCLGYYDDYNGDFDILATLRKTCEICTETNELIITEPPVVCDYTESLACLSLGIQAEVSGVPLANSGRYTLTKNITDPLSSGIVLNGLGNIEVTYDGGFQRWGLFDNGIPVAYLSSSDQCNPIGLYTPVNLPTTWSQVAINDGVCPPEPLYCESQIACLWYDVDKQEELQTSQNFDSLELTGGNFTLTYLFNNDSLPNALPTYTASQDEWVIVQSNTAMASFPSLNECIPYEGDYNIISGDSQFYNISLTSCPLLFGDSGSLTIEQPIVSLTDNGFVFETIDVGAVQNTPVTAFGDSGSLTIEQPILSLTENGFSFDIIDVGDEQNTQLTAFGDSGSLTIEQPVVSLTDNGFVFETIDTGAVQNTPVTAFGDSGSLTMGITGSLEPNNL